MPDELKLIVHRHVTFIGHVAFVRGSELNHETVIIRGLNEQHAQRAISEYAASLGADQTSSAGFRCWSVPSRSRSRPSTRRGVMAPDPGDSMPRQRKAKPPASAYSRVIGDNWRQKLGFIRARNEQEAVTPVDVQALFEYIEKLEAYLDRAAEDATAGVICTDWRKAAGVE